MKVRGKFSVQFKLLSAISVMALIGLFAFGIMAYQSQRALSYGKERMVKAAAQSWVDKIDRVLFERVGDAQAFAFSEAAKSRQQYRISRFMNEMTRAYSPVYELMIVVDGSGKVLVTNTKDGRGHPIDTSFLIGRDFSREKWFKAAISGRVARGNAYVTNPFRAPYISRIYGGSGEAMAISAPILSQDLKTVIGVWTNFISWKKVVGMISAEDMAHFRDVRFKEIFAFLLGSDGTYLLHPLGNQFELTTKQSGFTTVEQRAKREGYVIRKTNADPKIFRGEVIEAVIPSRGYSSYRGLGWYAVLQVPASDALNTFNLQLIWTVAFLFLLITLFSYLVVNRIANAIARFRDVSLKIASGDFYQRVLIPKPDPEIEDMSNAFNSMADVLTQTIRRERDQRQLITEQQSRLIQSSRMVALGEMAGGVAHEINNPLSVIIANTELLKRMEADQAKQGRQLNPEQTRKMIAGIETTSKRIAKIVRGLLFFAHEKTSEPFEEAKLKTIVEDTLSFCRERFAQNGIRIFVRDIPEGLVIECRPIQISQILLNLLNNSFDAVLTLPEKWVSIDYLDSANEIEIAVTDSGTGIPREIKDKVMEPFFTTKPPGKGTGLGLSLSKGIASMHEGTLELDSASKNTRFVLRLPKRHRRLSA